MIGIHVRSIDNDLGIGKLVEISAKESLIEYFISIGNTFTKSVPKFSLELVKPLNKQTRCYHKSKENETWQIGRVGEFDRDDSTYEINLPGKRTIWAPANEIYIRCNKPIKDPTDILILKAHETPYFHTRRSVFVRCLTEQRAVTRGMTALISSCINLFPHQFEVARRVLEDPVQRYLLADEVGLGKTIEAGIILRQYLLDEPKGRALMVVPGHLLNQWRQELDQKFYLDDYEERVSLVSHDEVIGHRAIENLGMLIIDEAHHVAGKALSGIRHEQSQFRNFFQLARQAQRLLLLSATPVLNNERDFLAMLHLLDPDNYKLDELEQFSEKVRNRQEIGHVLLSLQEGADHFILEIGIEKLRELFPKDTILSTLLDKLQDAINSDDNPVIAQAVRSVRIHTSETYRLHRRMLRHRRESVKDVIKISRFTRNQGENNLVTETDLDERAAAINEVLDDWRITALGTLDSVQAADGSETDNGAKLERIFNILFQAAGTWLQLLKAVVDSRLKGELSEEINGIFSATDLSVLVNTPQFKGEKEILSAILDILNKVPEEGDRLDLLEQVLKQLVGRTKYKGMKTGAGITPPPKIVIFTNFTLVAEEILRHLQAVFGAEAVTIHSSALDKEILEENIKRFQEGKNCFVLVCDSSGEEGRNLQFADWLFHFDLPWSPNKLEQRIGRIDRIGRNLSVRSRVFTGADEGVCFHEAWFQLLKDGFGIFTDSIASLQMYVDRKLTELQKKLFHSGAEGFVSEIDNVRSEIAEEKVKISEQNALDEIDTIDQRSASTFTKLVQYDSNDEIIQKRVNYWATEALKFHRTRSVDSESILKYSYSKQTLIPADILIELFSGPLVDRKGTFDRKIALENPGIKLYRIGEDFIEALAHYVNWDDRGKSFAMWRQDPNWDVSERGEWVGFRFDYLIEANLNQGEDLLGRNIMQNEKKALRRRADAFFQPEIQTIFLDFSMNEVVEPLLLSILRRPYSKHPPHQDYNLNDELLGVIEKYFTTEQWKDACYQTRLRSEEILRGRDSFRNNCHRRALVAERELSIRMEQLRLRLERDHSNTNNSKNLLDDLKKEKFFKELLVKGLKRPRIRLDAMGLIIVSGSAPTAVN